MKNKVRFYLHGRQNKNSEQPIYISFRSRKDRMYRATGLMINPKHWDDTHHRAMRGSTHQGIINAELDRLELATVNAFVTMAQRGVVTPDALQRAVFGAPSGSRGNNPNDLFALYRYYITEVDGVRAVGTVKIHKAVLKHLESFACRHKVNTELPYIDSTFIEKFVKYLLNEVGLTNPSAEKIVRTLRAVLNWSNQRGIITPDDYKRFTAKSFRHGQHSRKVYLNKMDLAKIEALDLSRNERLARVRDCLLFQCWTGIRYGDLLELRRENVVMLGDGSYQMELVTRKNRKDVTVPLLETADRIWRMYEGQLPNITNQRQNKYIKELCMLAGIDDSCVTVTYSGPKRIEKRIPKHDLIGTHTSKRSFVTLMAAQNVSLASILIMTGNSRDTIDTYMLATTQDAATEVREKFAR